MTAGPMPSVKFFPVSSDSGHSEELISFLHFLLGPEMFKNADSSVLERDTSPKELRTPVKSRPTFHRELPKELAETHKHSGLR